MKRIVVCVAALVLAVGGPAYAAQVRGGSSFDDAPVLAPGRYRDTIRPTETLFYAVELLPGEKLRARVVLETFGDEDIFADTLTLTVYSPTRDRVDDASETLNGSFKRRVLTAGRGVDYSVGGTYYLSFAMPNQFGELPRRREYDIALTVRKTGRPIGPSPTPTPTVTLAPTPEVSSPSPGPGGGSDLAGLLGAGAIAFIVGAAAGAVRRNALGRSG